jgi:uncharacterized membrane protein
MSGVRHVKRTRFIAQAGVIAALYAAASMLALSGMGTLASGPIQFRISEALTVLAMFTPAAVPGLWIGTCLANQLVGGLGLIDVVFGGLGTLLGAWWTWRFRGKTGLALLGPVLFNALIVPAYLPIVLHTDNPFGAIPLPAFGLPLGLTVYLFGVATVALGQAVVIYGAGWFLLAALRRVGIEAILKR